MIWFHTVATIAPALLPLLMIYGLWPALEVAPHIAVFVFFLSLIPLAVQVCLWDGRQARPASAGPVRPMHPFGLVLPLGMLLALPLWPLAERVARQIPAACSLVAGERVTAGPPRNLHQDAVFAVHVHGWGNPRSYGFTGGVVVYTRSDRKFEDLYFDLPEKRGHWTNSYTTFFPLTREAVGEYVRRSDDFPRQEAALAVDKLWDTLTRYAEKRDLPPMVDHFYQSDEPRMVSYVRDSTVYLYSCSLAAVPLAGVSWVLARRYLRQFPLGTHEPL